MAQTHMTCICDGKGLWHIASSWKSADSWQPVMWSQLLAEITLCNLTDKVFMASLWFFFFINVAWGGLYHHDPKWHQRTVGNVSWSGWVITGFHSFSTLKPPHISQKQPSPWLTEKLNDLCVCHWTSTQNVKIHCAVIKHSNMSIPYNYGCFTRKKMHKANLHPSYKSS